jgi:hypothetical protein
MPKPKLLISFARSQRGAIAVAFGGRFPSNAARSSIGALGPDARIDTLQLKTNGQSRPASVIRPSRTTMMSPLL